MSGFGSFHPIVLFTYYVIVLLFSMFSMHPVPIAMSLLGAVLFDMVVSRPLKMLGDLLFYLELVVLITLTNPLFVHNGQTVLFFMNDLPITREALTYGFVMGCMLVSVIYWCKCYQLIMTTDKFIYLFGRAVPRLSLVLSMVLRLIPLFLRQSKEIARVQRTMGMQPAGFLGKLRFALRNFDSLVGWSLENAIDTADSMKARGFGLKGRSSFSIFPFQKRDFVLLFVIGILGSLGLLGFAFGAFTISYYPVIDPLIWSPVLVLEGIFLFILMLLPAVIEGRERILWKYLRSNM